MRSRINLLVVMLTLLFTSACILDTAHERDPRPSVLTPILCETDAECSSYNRNCQHGICVDGPKKATMVVSTVIIPPPERVDLSPISIRGEALDFAETHTVILPPTVSVQGVVSKKGQGSRSRAQLFFSRQDDLPGRRFTQSLTTEEDGSFALQLPEGDYKVSIRDEQDGFLERIESLRVSRAQESAMTYFDMPSTDEFIRWTGRLVRFDSLLETRPVEGVTIWATDVHSNTQSSLAVTKEDGVFSVYLHRDVEAFRLHLRGRTIQDGEQSFLIPATSFSTLLTGSIGGDTKDAEIPGYELMLGVLEPSMRVQGVVHSTDNEPVAGARVLAQARLPALDGNANIAMRDRANLEARAVTDEHGAFELYFPPFDEVRLTAFAPDNTSRISDDTSLRRIGVAAGDPSAPFLLRLDTPVPVELEVYDSQGQAVEEYHARFAIEDSELLSPRYFDASMDEFAVTTGPDTQNSNQVLLPEGLWELTLSPREDLTLPLSWLSTFVEAPGAKITVQLPPGIAAGFIVEDEQGDAVRGASIELWLESPEDDSPPTLLGSTQSNAAGEATILVPWLSPAKH